MCSRHDPDQPRPDARIALRRKYWQRASIRSNRGPLFCHFILLGLVSFQDSAVCFAMKLRIPNRSFRVSVTSRLTVQMARLRYLARGGLVGRAAASGHDGNPRDGDARHVAGHRFAQGTRSAVQVDRAQPWHRDPGELDDHRDQPCRNNRLGSILSHDGSVREPQLRFLIDRWSTTRPLTLAICRSAGTCSRELLAMARPANAGVSRPAFSIQLSRAYFQRRQPRNRSKASVGCR